MPLKKKNFCKYFSINHFSCFDSLHEVKTEEPYVLEEKGWGEFDMRIVLCFVDNVTDPKVLTFDLHFAQSNYSTTHKLEFPNASQELIKLLAKDPSSSRKGGKKPMSSTSSSTSNKSKSKSNNDNNNANNNSNSSSSSRQIAKKKPVSSSPHAKTAKKAKPESTTTITTPATTTKSKSTEKYSKKSSYSPPSLSRSPSLSPAPDSPPLHSHITNTATPDSSTTSTSNEKNSSVKTSPAKNNTILDGNAEHIYNMHDVYNLDAIHRAKLDEATRERWGIPEVIWLIEC